MIGYLSNFGADAILSGIPMPVSWHAKMHLDDPGADALLNPAADTRRLSFNMTAPAGGISSNSDEGLLAFATDTEIITHLSLWDSDTTGDPWWIVEMLSPSAVIAGTTTRLAKGLLVLQFAIWS